MHIVVCVKQVPQQNSVKINADLSINSDGIDSIISLFDEHAIEAGLLLNEKYAGQVTILSIGPAEWKEQIRRALAMGATDALLLCDPAFAALDVLGAARVAAAGIRKLGNIDLVICGRNSTDDESGAFGPSLARLLGWPRAPRSAAGWSTSNTSRWPGPGSGRSTPPTPGCRAAASSKR